MDEAPAAAATRATRRAFPPLRVWMAAGLLALLAACAGLGYIGFVRTPIPSPSDRAEFRRQIEELHAESRALRRAGRDPLTVVFVGTSRTKNVSFDAGRVRAAARDAGLERPVVSRTLAVNWGGFERLEESVGELARMGFDYAVVMPELLYEDFAAWSRLKIALRYLQQRFWLREFALFDPEREFAMPACSGFGQTAELRARAHRRWMRRQIDGAGPASAAAAMKQLAAAGTQVYLAEIPTHSTLAALRRDTISPHRLLALHHLDGTANIRPFSPAPIPDSAFCDYAHIAPERAGRWLDQLFASIAADRARTWQDR